MGLMMFSFLARYWKLLVGAAVVLAIVAAVLMYGSHEYDQGVQSEQSKQIDQAVKAAKGRGAVDDAVGRLPDGGALSELRRDWSRD